MELKIGDIVRLRKKHPCGSYDWQVVRLGADIGIKCQGCGRRVLLERRGLERRIKAIINIQAEAKHDGSKEAEGDEVIASQNRY